eukprot:scaffold1446_cov391-Prasinococcus_capsulatus_cf.AAC.20
MTEGSKSPSTNWTIRPSSGSREELAPCSVAAAFAETTNGTMSSVMPFCMYVVNTSGGATLWNCPCDRHLTTICIENILNRREVWPSSGLWLIYPQLTPAKLAARTGMTGEDSSSNSCSNACACSRTQSEWTKSVRQDTPCMDRAVGSSATRCSRREPRSL